jgi:hypothetical protein
VPPVLRNNDAIVCSVGVRVARTCLAQVWLKRCILKDSNSPLDGEKTRLKV